jgi:hypothetical protein
MLYNQQKNTSKINLLPRSPSRVLRAFLGITEGNFIQVLIPSQPMRYPPQTLRKLKTLAFFLKVLQFYRELKNPLS